MAFRVLGLDPGLFANFIGRTDAELAARGARRCRVDTYPGFPDRIAVRDLAIGETAILLNYEHQPADTPYRSRHAIFVGETAREALDVVDTIPDALYRRPISLRAFDDVGDMRAAELCAGEALIPGIERLFADPGVAYLHAHYALRGCYAARIVRSA
ncbi:DUF1203 domain-containing protein [Sphingomonas sp. TREG-RG-20F-R18-01]|uniref:DUF1203 domain-containing protein n=1 Tax=Sphingomonas sp. TREG-RG-20F-R18-01 TaxID=2914982 RepID=UPI001F5A9DD3|nr:DUF1203 domain-containing protein [Sphingomonas sp. TREG-RG-20F-R18-01]